MPDDPKGLMRRFYDGINAGNLDVIDELLADDIVEHEKFGASALSVGEVSA
jgi:hypothetical protein